LDKRLPATPVKMPAIRASEKKRQQDEKGSLFYKEKIDTDSSGESMSIGPTNADTNEAEGSFSSIVNPAHGSGASQDTCQAEKRKSGA
jgi:hypothetical protein